MVANNNNHYCCPCNINSRETTVPNFVGNDNYCKSEIGSGNWSSVLHANDPIWDRQQCRGLQGPLYM